MPAVFSLIVGRFSWLQLSGDFDGYELQLCGDFDGYVLRASGDGG